jgi:hypothetical protein
VEWQWQTDWEDTGVTTKDVLTAACRPATFLWWVYNKIYTKRNRAAFARREPVEALRLLATCWRRKGAEGPLFPWTRSNSGQVQSSVT